MFAHLVSLSLSLSLSLPRSEAVLPLPIVPTNGYQKRPLALPVVVDIEFPLKAPESHSRFSRLLSFTI